MKVYKGKIFKIGDNYAVVMSDTGDFHAIKKKGQMLVSGDVIYTTYDIVDIKQTKRFNKAYTHIALVASLLLLLFVGTFNYLVTTSTYAIISLDINPSIDLYMNKELEITKTEGHNAEGKELSKLIKKGMNLNEAIQVIMKEAYAKGYLNEEKDEILVASAVIKKTNTIITEEINTQIYNTIELESKSSVCVYSISVSEVNLKASSEANMSIGRYELYLQYQNEAKIASDTSVELLLKTILDINLKNEKVKITEKRTKGENLINHFEKQINEKSSDLVEVVDIITDNIPTEKTIVNEIYQNGTDTVNKIINDSTDTVDKIVNDSTDTVNKIVNDSTDTVNKIVNDSTDTVNKIVDKVIEDSTDAVNKIVDDSTNTINKTVDDGNNIINKIDGNTDKINPIIDNSKDTIDKMINDNKDTIEIIEKGFGY